MLTGPPGEPCASQLPLTCVYAQICVCMFTVCVYIQCVCDREEQKDTLILLFEVKASTCTLNNRLSLFWGFEISSIKSTGINTSEIKCDFQVCGP